MNSINYSKETRFVDLPIESRCLIRDLDNHIMKVSLSSSKTAKYNPSEDIVMNNLFEVLFDFVNFLRLFTILIPK